MRWDLFHVLVYRAQTCSSTIILSIKGIVKSLPYEEGVKDHEA